MARKRSAARRRLERHVEGGTSGGPKVVNIPEGVQFFKVESDAPKRVDILEYEVTQKGNPCADVGEATFERTYYRHGNLGPNGKGMCVCLSRTYNEACPVCEYLKTVDWSDEEQKNAAKPMNAKERQLFNVYDTANTEAGVQIWEASYHVFGKQLDSALANADEDDGVDDFCSLGKDGKTLKIAFEEKQLGKTTFYDTTAVNFKKRATDHTDTKVYDLDTLLSHPTYDEVKAIMEGGTASDSEEAPKAAPAPKAEPKAEPKEETEEFECPGGGTFGKDVDEFGAVCQKCPKWNECDDLAAEG